MRQQNFLGSISNDREPFWFMLYSHPPFDAKHHFFNSNEQITSSF
jgi:hypothetical protein